MKKGIPLSTTLLIALFSIAGLASSKVNVVNNLAHYHFKPTMNSSFIFTPYKDTSINLNWNTDVISTKIGVSGSNPEPFIGHLEKGNTAVTLAFATGTCTNESWGGVSGVQLAAANIKLLANSSVHYIISTGGANGAFYCDSEANMKSFIQRYASKNMIGIDFDIEGGYTQTQLGQLMQATASYQHDASNPPLRVSLTLATLATKGSTINSLGQWALQAARAAKLNFNVNLMVMDYGNSGCQKTPAGACDMAASAIFAAKEFSQDYNVPLNRIELTPMVGLNDTQGELTNLANMQKITQFALENHLAGLHYWSFDRDTPCASPTPYPSPTCSGTANKVLGFDRAILAQLRKQKHG